MLGDVQPLATCSPQKQSAFKIEEDLFPTQVKRSSKPELQERHLNSSEIGKSVV